MSTTVPVPVPGTEEVKNAATGNANANATGVSTGMGTDNTTDDMVSSSASAVAEPEMSDSSCYQYGYCSYDTKERTHVCAFVHSRPSSMP
jgi:hypothetical protein